MTEPTAAVITWDWREQPDLKHLARVIETLSGGSVHLRPVVTNSDQYAVVVANTDLDEASAQATYERWREDGQDVGEVRRG